MSERDRLRDAWYESLDKMQGWRSIGPDEIWAEAWNEAIIHCAALCNTWSGICRSGKRWGCAVGAEECAKLIKNPDNG